MPLTFNKRPVQKLLVFIIAVAFLLRLVYVMQLGVSIYPDAKEYNGYALNLLHHGEYEYAGMLASRTPGYPLFLSGAYLLLVI